MHAEDAIVVATKEQTIAATAIRGLKYFFMFVLLSLIYKK
jgi:hypothetical protein